MLHTLGSPAGPNDEADEHVKRTPVATSDDGRGTALALTVGATVAGASSPRDELAVWVGHWKIRIETKDTRLSRRKAEDFDAKCSYLPHGAFVFCDYLSLRHEAGSKQAVDDISLFYYSEVDRTFKYTNVAAEGCPHESLLLVDGNVWTRPFQIPRRNGGVVEAREIYDFVSPDRHLARLEISIDRGAHWTVVNEAVGTRVR